MEVQADMHVLKGFSTKREIKINLCDLKCPTNFKKNIYVLGKLTTTNSTTNILNQPVEVLAPIGQVDTACNILPQNNSQDFATPVLKCLNQKHQ